MDGLERDGLLRLDDDDLFWTAVLVVMIWAIRSFGTKHSPTPPTPLEVLERRFAAGDIDREDFEERKRLLIRS